MKMDYWGSGLSESTGHTLHFHWVSTASNICVQLEHIKRRLGIKGNIVYHGTYNPSKDSNAIELGELGKNL